MRGQTAFSRGLFATLFWATGAGVVLAEVRRDRRQGQASATGRCHRHGSGVGHRPVAVGAEHGVPGGAERLGGPRDRDRADAVGADVGHLAGCVLGGVDLGGQRDREGSQLRGVHLIQRGVDRGLVGIGDQGRECGGLLRGEFAVRRHRVVGRVWLVVDEPESPAVAVWSGHRRYHLS
jgi:hypothetical protein